MIYNIVIKEEALNDIQSSYSFYEDQLNGLGDDFLSELDEYINIIQTNPTLFEQKHQPYREALINRFPYLVVYEIIEKDIIIYAVFHTKRSPQKKYKK